MINRVEKACRIIEVLRRGPVNRSEIDKALNQAPRYSEVLLREMKRSGLIESKRGPRGCYWLSDLGKTADVCDLAKAVLNNGSSSQPLIEAWKGMAPRSVLGVSP